jgi:hypothetical protein
MTIESSTSASITTKKDFKDTPAGKYRYWAEELNTSMKARQPWWKRADKIVDRFTGGHSSKSEAAKENNGGFDLNLFHSNTKTLGDMLYGNTPKIDVSRRYAQPNDDVGRVAAEMMERLLNIDVADNGAEIEAVFRSALQDRLLAGLGCAKVRYTMESEQVPVQDEMGQPMIGEDGQPVMQEKLVSEDAPIDYYYWGDILWGWCRNWAGMPWIGFRSYMTQDELRARWGDEVADNVKLKKQTKSTSDAGDQDATTDSAWMRAEVWEVWCKETRMVHWIILGYDKQLEEKEDILELSGFWPVPPFFIANVTTSLYTPTPDFTLAQDLYNEVDKLQTRIAVITEAVRVVGVYNSSADNLKKMFSAGSDNDLIPVENWALFGENGGIAGQVEWLPIGEIVAALQQLVGLRDSTIALLQQTTGMTDVMRGSLDNQYEGVAQTETKTKFGSVRIQALQEQFARFAGDLMQIKAEVISRHFSPETIFKRANMQFSVDEELVPQAIELLKDPSNAKLRVAIRPESVAMIDHQALKGERTEYMNAVATYMQSAGGIMEADPSSKPFILQLLQWGLAGFKGSSEIEGVIDKAIEASQEAEKAKEGQPEQDPAAVAAQMAQQLEQLKGKNKMGEIQAKATATSIARQEDMQADMQTAHEAHLRKMAEIQAGLQAKVAEIQTSLEADLLMEQAQAQSNIMQTQATVEGEIKKDVVEHNINMQAEQGKTALKIKEISVNAEAKIKESKAKTVAKPEAKSE